ncbi:MAG TPA: hypothetical protein VKS01_11265 [Bryobacteraceae bacterium]|nr:hypothetical protein [Bryobacteraceae bacterium]
MRRVAIILLSIAALCAVAWAGDEKAPFKPGPAESYPTHQTLDNITIAAIPYVTEEQEKSAFGKAEPMKYGVVPVLVIFENHTGKTLRLDLETEYVDPGNHHVEATPASDVVYIGAQVKRPPMPGSRPFPFPRGTKKGPLNTPEIETRAFAAKMVTDGSSAYGFFYFETEPIPGSKLYLTGIKDAQTGKDYFYFEVPLDTK